MRNQNPLQRARDNVRKFVVRAEIQSYEFATLGKPDGTIVAPGVRNVYIVKDNNVATALNEANVPHNAGLPLKVRFEHNRWVVKGVDSRASAALLNLPGDPYGVPPHPLTTHNDVVITGLADGEVIAWDAALGAWVNASPTAGAVDSVNGQTGVVVLDTDDIAEGASNRYLTQERVEDYAAAMITGGTHLGISASYDDLTGLLSLDARTAGDARYAPIAKGVTNGDSHDHNGGDGGTIAYSSLSGTPTVYTREEIEDFVGAMLGGTQTGIAVAYVDASGLLTFDVQTSSDARYGRLAMANTWTQNQTLNSTQTSGSALAITRNLTSTSTDSPVVSLIQDHASDDQPVLRIQQDGAAAIVNIYDTTDLVIQVADGGRLLLTPTATSGAALSVVRDLASASTDWPVVDLIQENSGDDQPLLQLRQDGTGNLITAKDGVNTVFQVQDGGLVVINQVGTTGIGFSVNRNLAAASTNNVVAEFVQDNTGDDQAVLRIQQDGTGNILELYDGASLVVSVADGGIATFTAQAKFDDGILLSPGGTQDYSFDDDGANALTLNALSTGKDFDFRIHTQDADGTDNVLISLYAVGKPGSYTNYERGRLIYAAASQEFRFDTGAAGSGTVRPLVLLTGGNTNQIRLATDGTVGFKVATPKGLVHGHDGTGGFLHVSKTGVVGSAVEIIPDGTGDVTKGVNIFGTASNSTPTTLAVNLFVTNGGTGDVTDGGGNTLRFSVAANGQLTVIRQAGAATWECTVWLAWK